MTEKKLPGPAYRIRTERLLLRCWDPSDAADLRQTLADNREHLLPFMPWALDEPEELQKKIERLRVFRDRFDLGEDFIYGIFNRENTRILGGCGLHRRIGPDALEIGYWIDKDHLNRGLATEASAALVKVAFEIEMVQRVEIHCDPLNVASAAVPRKLGFENEATLRKRQPSTQGSLHDAMIWTIFADDYPGSVAARAIIEAEDAIGRRIL
jgi:RimJ/RimL family protein N-acetyltransferase